MVRKFYSLSVLTLFVGVLFVGCSGSTNPLVSEAQSQLQSGDLNAALEAADQAIAEYPQDPLGYYYRGVILGDLAAEQDDPSARQSYYQDMNESFQQATEIASQMEEPPGQLENLDAVKVATWSNEHNRAIQLATSDSLQQTVENPMQQAAQHLQNATLIMPDSVVSWDVLAEIQTMNNDMEAAISAKERVFELKDEPNYNDYSRLAEFYRFTSQHEEAIDLLTDARNAYPDSVALTEQLADSYMQTGQYDQSISAVDELIERDPDNPQYHLALGTQLYQAVIRLNDSLSTNSDQIFELEQQLNQGGSSSSIQQQITNLQEDNQQLQQQIEEYTSRAIEELNMVIEQRPNDATASYTLGVIYQNRASALFEQRNQTTDNAAAAEFDAQGKENLNEAMQYYESAVEIDPDNQQYWESLYRVYVTLGMDEQAQEAAENAGL